MTGLHEWREWRGFYVSKDGLVIGPSGRVIRGTKQSKGYLQTTTSAKKKILLHHIVAGAWDAFNSSKGTQVDHIDGDKLNNAPKNLRVVDIVEHRLLDAPRRIKSNMLKHSSNCPL